MKKEFKIKKIFMIQADIEVFNMPNENGDKFGVSLSEIEIKNGKPTKKSILWSLGAEKDINKAFERLNKLLNGSLKEQSINIYSKKHQEIMKGIK